MNKPRYDYEKLYQDLLGCSTRSPLYATAKRALTKRGNWKKRPSGSYRTRGIVGVVYSRQTNYS